MGKRILFLTPQLPYPPQQGTAIRNYNLIRQAAKRHEVHLLSFEGIPASVADLGPLRDLCAALDVVPIPRRSNWQRLFTVLASPRPDIAYRLSSPLFTQKLEAVLRETKPDIVQIEGLEMAQYGLWARQLASESLWLVYDAHNAEYLLQQRIFETDARRPRRWLGALYSFIQWQKLHRYEALVCRQVQRVIACSLADSKALARLVPGLEAVIIPNGVDTQYYQPDAVAALPLHTQSLVFTGKMDFRPNVDAVLWFCTEVLPIIQRAVPDVHFYIVGKNPHPRLAPLRNMPNVTMTGFVEDVRPYIAAAAVYVVPLLTGGGTRLKVLEAMAMGKAVVSTTLGCEGIHVAPGQDVILADDPAAFAAQVLALLQDKARREQLGRAARTFVERYFDWDTVAAPLEQVYAH
ncbi:MAG: glycosyltransferase [Chloroflexi bacterium]|nr:glycosyltransferase [Chloroflexota bacterium]